jgi:hypothetical protein
MIIYLSVTQFITGYLNQLMHEKNGFHVGLHQRNICDITIQNDRG